jgi:predicted RNA binding protein YcfA (HicA-like mRNA interferase family)
MGRLSGFSYQKVTQKLKKLGFEFYRNAKGDHEIWFNPETSEILRSCFAQNDYFSQFCKKSNEQKINLNLI